MARVASAGVPGSVVLASRCAVTASGKVVCTFVARSALDRNDSQPLITWSGDGGLTWSSPRLIWPNALQERHSISGAISTGPRGSLLFFGDRTRIDVLGETKWSKTNAGLKQNELVWSRSSDEGITWEPLRVIPMPVSGSAEVTGAMQATRQGELICCYTPYNTFDPSVAVEKNQIIGLVSGDGGRSWRHAPMLRFPDSQSQGAEAWVVELSDGRLLGTGWHILEKQDPPNAFAISHDVGRTWRPTSSTGIRGQSTALAPMPDGKALFVYNQRKFGDIGVWLALAKPTDADFGIIHNERIWAAETAAQKPVGGDMKDWASFAFGKPSVTVLPDGGVLTTLWTLQPSNSGIRYVKLRLV